VEPVEDKDLTGVVKQLADQHAAPAALRERIVGALRMADAAPLRTAAPPLGWWLGLGGAFAMGMIASIAVAFFMTIGNSQERLAQEVVSGHVRSLMVAHLADVASSDRHTVKPWFVGKLDFLPPVVDMSSDGFPLVGGRLDYIDGRPTAALVYKSRQHTINVFVWRRDGRSTTPPEALALRGFNLTGWESPELQFWLASDLNAVELRQFSTRLREEANKVGL